MKQKMKIIFAFVLGIIISGTVVYAATIAASQITYSNTSGLKDANGNNVTNVQGAIDALYSKVGGKINVEWKTGNETYLGIMYLDPTQPNNICDEHNTESFTGMKTGCMKWYIYKEDNNGTDDTSDDVYKAILDHNTTARVIWNANNSNVDLADSNLNSLINDLKMAWINNGTNANSYIIDVGIISGQEVADIVENTSWKASDESRYYFDKNGNTFGTNPVATTQGSSNYAWLYEYTYDCEQNGCNVQDNNTYTNVNDSSTGGTYGYWADTPYTGNGSNVWGVGRIGGFGHDNANVANRGLRPVIIVPKSAIAN